MCRVQDLFYVVPEIRGRVRIWRALGGKFGSIEKRPQSNKLWTTDHPSRHVPSSQGGRAFNWPSDFKGSVFTADDRGSCDEHSHILMLSQNTVTSKILKTNAKLTL